MINKSSYFVDCSNGWLQIGYHGVVNQLIPGACQGYASRDCPKIKDWVAVEEWPLELHQCGWKWHHARRKTKTKTTKDTHQRRQCWFVVTSLPSNCWWNSSNISGDMSFTNRIRIDHVLQCIYIYITVTCLVNVYKSHTVMYQTITCPFSLVIWTIVLRILQIGTWFRDLAIHGNELQAKGIKKAKHHSG